MIVTDVAWVPSQRGLPTLELTLDGHPAHFRSRQDTDLLRRGILNGLTFLASERSAQAPGDYLHGDYRQTTTASTLWAAPTTRARSPSFRICAMRSAPIAGRWGSTDARPGRQHLRPRTRDLWNWMIDHGNLTEIFRRSQCAPRGNADQESSTWQRSMRTSGAMATDSSIRQRSFINGCSISSAAF